MDFKEKIKELFEKKKKKKMKSKEDKKPMKSSIAQKINFGGKYKTKS